MPVLRGCILCIPSSEHVQLRQVLKARSLHCCISFLCNLLSFAVCILGVAKSTLFCEASCVGA